MRDGRLHRRYSHLHRIDVREGQEVYAEFFPCPELAPYVSVFWTATSLGKCLSPHPTRVLPDGCVDIIFSDETRSGLKTGRVIGATTGPLVLYGGGVSDSVAVRFRPGGATPFVKVPLHEFTDSSVVWRDVFGPETGEIEERLSMESNGIARIAILESFLLGRTKAMRQSTIPPPLLACMNKIVESKGQSSVASLAQVTGSSARHLGRLFRDHVGLSTKQFCELVRFLNVIQSLQACGESNGAALAVNAGYFDQSHLIKEFQRFAGLSPSEFVLEVLGASPACPIPTIQNPYNLLHSCMR